VVWGCRFCGGDYFSRTRWGERNRGAIMSDVKEERSVRTVTRADLSETVYRRIGLSRSESAELVQEFLDEICDAAARGETVKLSSFGSFVVRSKSERIGRNPKTGVEVPILPRRVMVFKPSNVLKSRINGVAAPDET
jgi:integration host factor subunit alpha